VAKFSVKKYVKISTINNNIITLYIRII
jgi:hypothetical protein